MKVEIEECKGLRRASASVRTAGIISVKVPRHWNRATKQEVITILTDRLLKKDVRERKLLAKASQTQPVVSLSTQEALEAYVRQVNAETFNLPLGKIRIGYAKYTHLAQVNLRTKVMTVSKYCLSNVPAGALRYLIVHELAHYYVSGHGPKFWALVAAHVPDYRLQSRIIKAFHHHAVIGSLPEAKSDAENTAIQPLERHSRPLPAPPASTNPPEPIADASDDWPPAEESTGYEPDFDEAPSDDLPDFANRVVPISPPPRPLKKLRQGLDRVRQLLLW